nr:MAG TPA: tail assembly chaperone protein [Caudoviricetes sp.]
MAENEDETVKYLPDGGLQITLKRPVIYKRQKYDTLTLREPTLADTRKVGMLGGKRDEDPEKLYDHVMAFAKLLCTDMPPEAFEQIRTRDTYRIIPIITDLFGVPQLGGGK